MNKKDYNFRFFGVQILIAFLLLSLSLSSCKKGGGGVTGTEEEEPPAPAEITSSFESEETSFLPGEIQFIKIEGHSLQEDEYEANIADGMEITLYRYSEDTDNKTLVFIVPEEAPVDHELIFTLADQEQVLAFAIEDYEVIEDAEEFVLDSKNKISEQLNTIINETSDEETKQILQTVLSDLDKAMEDFPTLDISAQKQIAYIIKENLEANNVAKKAPSEISSVCDDISTRLTESPKKVANAATAGVSGGFLGGIKGTIINIFTTSGVFKILSDTIDDLEIFIDECIVPELSLESKNKAKQLYTFNHAESRSFSINSSKTLTDELIATVEEIKTSLSDLLSILPESWVEYLFENDFNTVEPVDSELLSLNISESDIEAEISAADSILGLTFTFDESSNPSETREFTFTLTDNEDLSLDVEAALKPPLPVAYDMKISTEKGESVTDTLKADYAASFTIEGQPNNGKLTLLDGNMGVFEYEPDEDFLGDDSFSFSATNNTGDSEAGTVSVAIADEYSIPVALHGVWENNFEGFDDDGIWLVQIKSNDIKSVFKEYYKECWEEWNELEIDKNYPRVRNGETYTYKYTYRGDERYEIKLSLDSDTLKVEYIGEGDAIGDDEIWFFWESNRVIDNLNYCENDP